jgi:hypothetical protein
MSGGAIVAPLCTCLGTLHWVWAATGRRRGSCLGCRLGPCLTLLMLLLMLLLLLLSLTLAIHLNSAIALPLPARVRAILTPVGCQIWPHLLAVAVIRLQAWRR